MAKTGKRFTFCTRHARPSLSLTQNSCPLPRTPSSHLEIPRLLRCVNLFRRNYQRAVSKGLAVLRSVVDLVPGHLGARLSMARAFYSTGQAELAHQALQVSELVRAPRVEKQMYV